MLRTVKGPSDARLQHVALLENEEGIQASLMEVINALIRKTIDLPRAELILRALNTAVRNARRVRFNASPSKMITPIPDYDEEPDPEPITPAHVKTADTGTVHVGMGPRPSMRTVRIGPQRSGTLPQTDPTQRKPPESIRQTEALKEREKASMNHA